MSTPVKKLAAATQTGAVLPPCRLCRNGVRYSLMLAAEDVNTDELLKRSPDA